MIKMPRTLPLALLQSALLLGVACAGPPIGDGDRTAGESPVAEANVNPDLQIEDPQRPDEKQEAQHMSELSREQRMAKRRELSRKHLERVPVQAPLTTQGEVPEDLLAKIVADLAEKIKAEAAAIQVLVATEIVWNDGALGCAEPGGVYTQALVPGYRVILNHEGQRYDYHADRRGPFMLCERPTVQPPLRPGEKTAVQ